MQFSFRRREGLRTIFRLGHPCLVRRGKDPDQTVSKNCPGPEKWRCCPAYPIPKFASRTDQVAGSSMMASSCIEARQLPHHTHPFLTARIVRFRPPTPWRPKCPSCYGTRKTSKTWPSRSASARSTTRPSRRWRRMSSTASARSSLRACG